MSPCTPPLPETVWVERRQWKRSAVYQEIFCQFKNPINEEVLISGYVVNISRGGLRILASQRIEPDTVIRVGIADEIDGLFTLLSSRVVYVNEGPSRKWLLGCTFTPKLREDILAWIEKIGGASSPTRLQEAMAVGL
jgi:hypothetical protein